MKDILSHPLLTAIAGGIAGSIFTWLTLKNEPPVISLTPSSITVNAAESVVFNGQGSSDKDGEIKHLKWSIGGNEVDTSTVASCYENEVVKEQITCQFTVPGSHVVSLSAVDDDGDESVKSSNVLVKMKGGYVGVVVRNDLNKSDKNLQNALNYGVDWVKVQSLLKGMPIVLYDPSSQGPVLSTKFRKSVEKAREFVSNSKYEGSLSIFAPFTYEVQEEILKDLSKIGLKPFFNRIPFSEVYSSSKEEMRGAGFVFIDTPEDLLKYYK